MTFAGLRCTLHVLWADQAMQNIRPFGIASLMLASFLAVQSPALAETIWFMADLRGLNELPSTGGRGEGTVSAQYDTFTEILSYTVDYSGLTGNAIAADFDGPATVRQEAEISLPVNGVLASPIEGAASVDRTQAADLISGNWYFNIYTADHKTGEIRGQVLRIIPRTHD
jgi:CHRD domain-containing protein